LCKHNLYDEVSQAFAVFLPERSDERQKLERLCRYISRLAISEKRLSLTSCGNVRYQLKTPYRDGTTHVIFSRWISLRAWPHWCPGPESTLLGSMVCSPPTANIVPW
jgi:hypothetical protein